MDSVMMMMMMIMMIRIIIILITLFQFGKKDLLGEGDFLFEKIFVGSAAPQRYKAP